MRGLLVMCVCGGGTRFLGQSREFVGCGPPQPWQVGRSGRERAGVGPGIPACVEGVGSRGGLDVFVATWGGWEVSMGYVQVMPALDMERPFLTKRSACLLSARISLYKGVNLFVWRDLMRQHLKMGIPTPDRAEVISSSVTSNATLRTTTEKEGALGGGGSVFWDWDLGYVILMGCPKECSKRLTFVCVSVAVEVRVK